SLLFIIGGSASGYIGNKKYNAKKGDFIFVPNNTPHHWKMNEPLEYLEISTPSLTTTKFNDVSWTET
ncbi:MAG: cupin domain-containing protein, partial [Patescibacteria group bacterium]|nr:cupin domain-containing protein [Patescibacteria group bacterium]